MAFNSIPQYDGSVAGNNTDVGGVSIAEGYPAANINNAMRQMLLQLKQYLAQSVTVASASTVDLGAQTGNYITISGSTTITSFGTIAAGTWRMLEFSGALQLTYNATSMILPGAANITTVAGDTAMVVSEGSGNWRMLAYQRGGITPPSTVNTSILGGRLTLTSGTAVTTSDVTAATTVYFTPFRGNQAAIYNGTVWQIFTLSELSVAVPATTATMYDVFLNYNSGTPALAVVAWTNDTTRATALTTQDNVLVKTGDTKQRYLGSFRTTAVSGQTEDSIANRFLWNYYNRSPRVMRAVEATANWTYSTPTFRQSNANTANQLNYIQGVSEDPLQIVAKGGVSGSVTAGVNAEIGIGLDSTTVNSATMRSVASASSTQLAIIEARYEGYPGIGKHSFMWLEKGVSATQTWYGTASGVGQNGITGIIIG